MSRRGLKKDEYKTRMIDAALEVIAETGFSHINVRKISERAGVSFGNFHYHFGGKEGLLFEALKVILSRIRAYDLRSIASENSAYVRLVLYIHAQFNPGVFNTFNSVVWVNYWSEASTQPQFSRLEKINRSRAQSNLRYYLRQIVPDEQAVKLAFDIHVIIDGLWIRKAHLKDALSSEQARETVLRFVRLAIPGGPENDEIPGTDLKAQSESRA